MMSNLSIDDLLEGVIVALGADVLPHLDSEKAIATTAMMQSVLTGVRQMLPVMDQYVVEEHNEMTAVLRGVANKLDGVDGAAAERVRERAATLGAMQDLPVFPDVAAQRDAHNQLSISLGDTMSDLDELQRGDVAVAHEALDVIRAHLAARLPRHAATISIEGGLLGRG